MRVLDWPIPKMLISLIVLGIIIALVIPVTFNGCDSFNGKHTHTEGVKLPSEPAKYPNQVLVPTKDGYAWGHETPTYQDGLDTVGWMGATTTVWDHHDIPPCVMDRGCNVRHNKPSGSITTIHIPYCATYGLSITPITKPIMKPKVAVWLEPDELEALNRLIERELYPPITIHVEPIIDSLITTDYGPTVAPNMYNHLWIDTTLYDSIILTPNKEK